MVAIKVDLEKAYDRIRWDFLRHVLVAVGLEENLIKLINFCVTSTKLSLLWNREKLGPITLQRGLHQGDPLPPYLFDLCVEHLVHRINNAVGAGQWKAVKASKTRPRSLSHFLR